MSRNMKALTPTDAYNLMHDGTLALSRAESYGFCVDEELARQHTIDIDHKIKILDKKFKRTELAKIWKKNYGLDTNFESGKQLGDILYNKMGYTVTKKTKTGNPATDVEALEEVDCDDLDYLTRIRKYQKLTGTFLKSILGETINGIIHPQYHLHSVITFRSSSSNPNFQNLPKRDKIGKYITRSILKPRPGNQLLEADYSSLEVGIACCYHNDPNMIDYLTKKGTDMHGDVCQQLFLIDDFDKKIPTYGTLRGGTKNSFIFPQFYGDYYKNNVDGLCTWSSLPKYVDWDGTQGIIMPNGDPITKHLKKKGIKNLSQFTDHIQKIEKHFWGTRFKVYDQWKTDWLNKYLKNGYMKTLTGFECSGKLSKNQIINFPVQGSAFHCLLWAFIEIEKELIAYGAKSRLIGQIHDAIVMDVYPPEKDYILELLQEVMVTRLMKAWGWINVPLSIETEMSKIDGSWAEMEVV